MQSFFQALSESQETLHVALLISITAISLFALCGLSFMFGKKRNNNKTEFLKFFFLIPLWLLLLTIFVYIGQLITERILPDAEQYPLASQVMSGAFGVIGIGFIAELRSLVPIPETNFFYGYLMSILALINIEIFSAIHMPLVVMFSAEFIIIYLSRTSTKPALIGLFLAVMTIPFIPNFISKWQGNNPYLLSFTSFYPSFKISFLMSCIILPFLLQCVRYLIGRGLWHRIHGSILKNAVTGTLSRSLFCFIVMIIVVVYVNSHPVTSSAPSSLSPADSASSTVYLHYEVSTNYAITEHRIILKSTTDVSRYDISISLPDKPQMLFSEQEYTEETNSVIHFTIDNPESVSDTIFFTTTETDPGTVTVVALDSRFYRIPVEFIQ